MCAGRKTPPCGTRKRLLRLGEWRNGLRSRLKSDRVKALVGSNPTSPTSAFLKVNGLHTDK